MASKATASETPLDEARRRLRAAGMRVPALAVATAVAFGGVSSVVEAVAIADPTPPPSASGEDPGGGKAREFWRWYQEQRLKHAVRFDEFLNRKGLQGIKGLAEKWTGNPTASWMVRYGWALEGLPQLKKDWDTVKGKFKRKKGGDGKDPDDPGQQVRPSKGPKDPGSTGAQATPTNPPATGKKTTTGKGTPTPKRGVTPPGKTTIKVPVGKRAGSRTGAAELIGELLGQAYQGHVDAEHRKLLEKALRDPALRQRIINDYHQIKDDNPLETLGRGFDTSKGFTQGATRDIAPKLIEFQKKLDARLKAVQEAANRSSSDPLYRQARRDCGGYETCVADRVQKLRAKARQAKLDKARDALIAGKKSVSTPTGKHTTRTAGKPMSKSDRAKLDRARDALIADKKSVSTPKGKHAAKPKNAQYKAALKKQSLPA
ncbi:hypothetical protein [Amycolatopsis anabasis]|uniref:hypothetical protein n=1 Tax=Amycolatopsis anabasis TaxID=1840409 RepID=UPI00131E5D45|nr:hypothetical protein [Amycolatopsis anabasis]